MIGRTDEALDDAEAGGPAGREERDMLHAEELGDRLLERERQRGIADQRRRARAVHSELLDRRDGDVADVGVGGKAQIILRREIDAFEKLAFVRAREALAARTGLGRPAERPQPRPAAQLLPIVEGFHPIQQVGAGEIAEIAHAPAKGCQSIKWSIHSLVLPRPGPPMKTAARAASLVKSASINGMALDLLDQLVERDGLGLEI